MDFIFAFVCILRLINGPSYRKSDMGMFQHLFANYQDLFLKSQFESVNKLLESVINIIFCSLIAFPATCWHFRFFKSLSRCPEHINRMPKESDTGKPRVAFKGLAFNSEGGCHCPHPWILGKNRENHQEIIGNVGQMIKAFLGNFWSILIINIMIPARGPQT